MAKIKDEIKALYSGNEQDGNQFLFESNYFRDKNGRVRIPVHERKKIFRYMYPEGSISAETKEVDWTKCIAKGRCELFKHYNDSRPFATAEAFCSAEELAGTKFDPNVFPETAETQSISRAMTNLAIPQFLDDVKDLQALETLDQTNELVKEYMKQFDNDIVTGEIEIKKGFQINISSDVRKETGLKAEMYVRVDYTEEGIMIIPDEKGEKKIQKNNRLVLGKHVLDNGFRIGTFGMEMKQGCLCIPKKHK